MFKQSSFFAHFYDLTGPKYAEKYEDSESGLKSMHFLEKNKKHDFIERVLAFLCHLLAILFVGIGGGLTNPQR